MPIVLHILTRPADELAAEVVRRQRARGECVVEVFDLGRDQPDYTALVERIFAADSVEAW